MRGTPRAMVKRNLGIIAVPAPTSQPRVVSERKGVSSRNKQLVGDLVRRDLGF